MKVFKKSKNHKSKIKVGNLFFGDKKIIIIAGPCAIESKKQIIDIAKAVKKAGADGIRGGAFKPRTSPYTFQGLGKKGLEYLKEASKTTSLPIITECMDTKDVKLAASYADCIQIGTRNMQNFSLLKAVGKIKKPILLKRGMSATYQELLMSAEYILASGNPNIILCERGIRTHETETRNTLDLVGVAYLKNKTHLPIIVDPSHGTGKKELVIPASCAAVAAGTDGLLIEVHTCPEKSVSDADQTILPEELENLIKKIKPIAKATDREV